jgi:SAM-dependent methyltransferase
MNANEIQEVVKKTYGAAASQVLEGRPSGGCGCGCGNASVDASQGDAPTAIEACCSSPVTQDLYRAEDEAAVPAAALRASLGCGNPVALVELHPGETVLDLGSGGGIDVLLSARRVGPQGTAYGLDMTPEMLELARRNASEAGVSNARFLEGTIEQIPLPNETVDVILSNCVINLSTDKDRVLRESLRVLKPGGRLAVSDLVFPEPPPPSLRTSYEAWAGCVAGALTAGEYREKLEAAGFVDVTLEPTRTFDAAEVGATLWSAFVRAEKPARS